MGCSGNFCGKLVSDVSAGLCWWRDAAYGPSVQVKTCGKPHERTSASDSRCDFAGIVMFVDAELS